MNYNKNKRSGFSLIELVVVVGIIAVISATVSSYVQDSMEEARYVTVQQNTKIVKDAIGRYFKDNLTYPTSLESLEGRYIHQPIRELLIGTSEGSVKIQVQVSNTGNPNVYQVPESDRRWVDYVFGGNAHGGKQIAAIKVVDINTPAPAAPPAAATYTLALAGSNITSSPVPGAYSTGTSVTVTVSPPAGQQVASLIVNGVNQESALSGYNYSFYLSANTTVTVAYEPIPLLLTLSGGKMTSSPAPGAIPVNTSVTITLEETPDTFTVNGVDQKASLVGNAYTFVMTTDTLVAATYGPPVNLTLTLTGDQITSNPAAGIMLQNTPVVITLDPEIWQQIDTFTINTVDKKASIVDNKYTFSIAATTTAAVTYAALPTYSSYEEYDSDNKPWNPGDYVLFDGNLYEPKWYTESEPGSDDSWTLISDQWSPINRYDVPDQIWYNGAHFEATGYSENAEPGLLTSPWKEIDTTEWRNFNVYTTGDVVDYNGSQFTSTSNYNKNEEPGIVGSHWQENTTEWRAFNQYNTDDIIEYNGAQFKATQGSMNEEPGVIGSHWNEITDQWRAFNLYTGGEEVWHNSIHYKAAWYNQNTEPPAACWTVIP